jgi:hypothetical protein
VGWTGWTGIGWTGIGWTGIGWTGIGWTGIGCMGRAGTRTGVAVGAKGAGAIAAVGIIGAG